MPRSPQQIERAKRTAAMVKCACGNVARFGEVWCSACEPEEESLEDILYRTALDDVEQRVVAVCAETTDPHVEELAAAVRDLIALVRKRGQA